jgi:hypothetical protein
MRPLVLLDVDGPLNPWAAKPDSLPEGYVEHRFRLSGWSRRKPLRMRLNPDHGADLARLAARTGAELVWATTWEHKANTMVGPAIGLPSLRVIEFAAYADQSTWKFTAVSRFARGRALAWLDDDFDMYPAARDAFLDRRHSSALPTFLARVNPRTGMTPEDLSSIETWLHALPDRTESGDHCT